MTVRQYATPLAFKQALEHRLKSSSTTGMDFGRRRQLLVFWTRSLRSRGASLLLRTRPADHPGADPSEWRAECSAGTRAAEGCRGV